MTRDACWTIVALLASMLPAKAEDLEAMKRHMERQGQIMQVVNDALFASFFLKCGFATNDEIESVLPRHLTDLGISDPKAHSVAVTQAKFMAAHSTPAPCDQNIRDMWGQWKDEPKQGPQ